MKDSLAPYVVFLSQALVRVESKHKWIVDMYIGDVFHIDASRLRSVTLSIN